MTSRSKVLLTGAALAAAIGISASRPASDQTSAQEMARLRTHFAVVLRELREADVSSLTPQQLSARSELISRLVDYAAAGRFPHNHVVAGRFVPVFRDEHRTLCAMGFLIASTGRDDIVDDVVRSANLARIPELARDERLRLWLDSAGLTVAEAARIQPMYDGDCGTRICIGPPPQPPVPVTTESRATAAYYIGSATASAVSGATTALSIFALKGDRTVARRVASVGLVSGAAQIALGASVLNQQATARSTGIANLVLGGASIGSSVWRLTHLPKESVVAQVSVTPFLTGRTTGLVLAARM